MSDFLAVEEGGHQRVLRDVDRGVRRRQGDRHYPGRRDEAQEHEHEHLALPEGEQTLEHRDRTLAVGALLGDPPVHRQRPEEGQEHDEERGYG